ncbi:hypothetical protein Bbelb_071530 [Branchiostoma belcheri]|nr:hypothetical protein Bbelb_071530 [Branchiostoma belcheri]
MGCCCCRPAFRTTLIEAHRGQEDNAYDGVVRIPPNKVSVTRREFAVPLGYARALRHMGCAKSKALIGPTRPEDSPPYRAMAVPSVVVTNSSAATIETLNLSTNDETESAEVNSADKEQGADEAKP